jgi:predicted PurR-regulated permease PerM
MMPDKPLTEWTFARELLDVLIRAGLVAVLVIFCFRVFLPFLNLMVWSLILAVTLYPLQVRLRRRFSNHDGRAATLIVVIVLVIIAIPTWLLGAALADSVGHAISIVKEGGVHVPPPSESVATWPLIGRRVYDFWMLASTDLTALANKFRPQVKDAGLAMLGTITGLGLGLLIFFAALIIAGIFMAYGEQGNRSAVQIASRIAGPENGPEIAHLCTSTIRAVAQGVVGIAFIQMLLVGVAFVVMGVPGAGLLALAVLLIGIMQLPATLITIPVIIFVIADQGVTASTVIFAIYVFVAGLADNVLKPLMLGRGVSVPMPVVLIGALGGMVTGGVIGLFIGPVMLAVGYQLFWRWVENQPQPDRRDEPKQP